MSERNEALITAVTWVHRVDGKVLAVRPANGDAFYLPGGLPEPGETLQETVAREVQEEVGIRLEPHLLTEVVRVEDEAHGRPGTTVRLICLIGPGRGSPVPDGTEIAEVRYLSPAEWHLFAPAVRKALESIAAR